jgi:hypothetical protein
LRWSIERKGLLDVALSGTYNLAEGSGPVRASATWQDIAKWTVSAAYSPATGSLAEFSVLGAWTDSVRTITWKLPFDTTHGRFERSSLDVTSKLDGVSLAIGVNAGLEPFAITACHVDAEVTTETGWGFTVGASYSASVPRSLRPDVGLFKDIAKCLRVGIERAASETWLYISILAFPEAVLRYAPRTFEVEVGS